MPKTETIDRFQTRMPRHVMEKISQAAGLMGSSLNQFMVQASLEKALNLIEKESVLKLTEQDAKFVFDLIETPPAPSEALIKAALDYRKKFPDD